MAEQVNVLMEKAGEQMSVPADKAEMYRLIGWKQVNQPVPAPAPDPASIFTPAERKVIAEIVAAEVAHSSLSPAEKKAVIEARAAEEKAKAEVAAAEEKAAKEQAAAEAKAAAAEAKAAEKKAGK